MSETIDVPGAGPMPKNTALLVGAATVVVVWVWWSRRKSATAQANFVIDPNSAFGSTDRVPPGGGGGATADSSTPSATPKIDSDAAWTQAGIEYMSRLGAEPTAVGAALGKYLDRQKLSVSPVDEVAMVRTVRGAYGAPPQKGDLPIITADAGTPAPVPDRHYVPDKVIGNVPGVAGSPWIWTTMKGNPTSWADVATEVYRANPADPAWQKRAQDIAPYLQEINANYGANLPKSGDIVYFR